MHYVLYNPFSSQRFTKRRINNLIKKLNKKKYEIESINILDIDLKEKEFITSKTKDDIVIICGGDGTIDVFLNKIIGADFSCRLYLYSCGSGNDLKRDFKGRLFEVTNMAKRLPHALMNESVDSVFCNGVGMGIDALVCQKKEECKRQKIKKSYFKIALESFKEFKTYSLDINIDGQDLHFDKVWFFVCNHGRFFGGGMKVAPKAKRDDDKLDIIVVNNVSKAKIIAIFPTIMLGWHTIFKKYVHCYQGSSISVIPSGCDIMQRDGETFNKIKQLDIKR